MNLAYKFRGSFERDLDSLIKNEIYLPDKDSLNDPFEGLFKKDNFDKLIEFFSPELDVQNLKSIFEEISRKILDVGIYSLSGNINNHLLWSHYANSHKGFAIEYDIDALDRIFNYSNFKLMHILEIDYKESLPEFTIDLIRDANRFQKFLIGTKSLDWSYESELRLIFNETGARKIESEAVKAIYFGLRCPSDEKQQIIDSLKGRNIEFYQMTSKNSYELDYIKVNSFQEAEKATQNLEKYEWLLNHQHLKNHFKNKGIFSDALNRVLSLEKIISVHYLVPKGSIEEPELFISAETDEKLAPIKNFLFKKINSKMELVY